MRQLNRVFFAPNLRQQSVSEQNNGWTFLTNHAHALVCLARSGDKPLREVAFEVGITERAVQRIVADPEDAGEVLRERVGRNNHYRTFRSTKLRPPLGKANAAWENFWTCYGSARSIV
jgi:DNA-binding MarR family transcriptional regulator